MSATSKPVSSVQTDVHPRLVTVVQRHLQCAWQRPLRADSRGAFATFAAWHASRCAGPWLLDSGCGTGASTLLLACQHPDLLVVGIDQSAPRLAVGQRALQSVDAPRNALLLRCDAADFWRLARDARLAPRQHLVFYPNPWPKQAQLRRRWHAHPAWPTLLALGGELELRCNWLVYAREWAMALALAGLDARVKRLPPAPPASPFERKYAASDHPLWRVTARQVAGDQGMLVEQCAMRA